MIKTAPSANRHATKTRPTARTLVKQAAKSLPPPFSFGDLAMAAWKMDRRMFGLGGYERTQQDARKIHVILCGSKGLVREGFLVQATKGHYRVGDRQQAKAMPETALAASPAPPDDAREKRKAALLAARNRKKQEASDEAKYAAKIEKARAERVALIEEKAQVARRVNEDTDRRRQEVLNALPPKVRERREAQCKHGLGWDECAECVGKPAASQA